MAAIKQVKMARFNWGSNIFINITKTVPGSPSVKAANTVYRLTESETIGAKIESDSTPKIIFTTAALSGFLCREWIFKKMPNNIIETTAVTKNAIISYAVRGLTHTAERRRHNGHTRPFCVCFQTIPPCFECFPTSCVR